MHCWLYWLNLCFPHWTHTHSVECRGSGLRLPSTLYIPLMPETMIYWQSTKLEVIYTCFFNLSTEVQPLSALQSWLKIHVNNDQYSICECLKHWLAYCISAIHRRVTKWGKMLNKVEKRNKCNFFHTEHERATSLWCFAAHLHIRSEPLQHIKSKIA